MEHEGVGRAVDAVVRAYEAWRSARGAEHAARALFVDALRAAVCVVNRGTLARELGLSVTRIKQILERA